MKFVGLNHNIVMLHVWSCIFLSHDTNEVNEIIEKMVQEVKLPINNVQVDELFPEIKMTQSNAHADEVNQNVASQVDEMFPEFNEPQEHGPVEQVNKMYEGW